MMVHRYVARSLIGAALIAPSIAQAQTEIVAPPAPDADALAAEVRVLATNPTDLSALLSAGELALKLGDTTAAAAFFARAERVDPHNGRQRAGLGSVLLALERPGEALRKFGEAEAYGYSSDHYAADRGLAFDLVGDQGRAQRDYRLAMRQKADDAEVLRRYALSLAIVGERERALEQIDPLLRRSDRAAWRVRAFVLAMTGDAAGAERIARTMLPAGMGDNLQPFFQRLPQLSAVDRAWAVHFGEVAPTPARLADAKLAPSLPPLPAEVRPKPPVQVAAVAPATKPDRRERRPRPTPEKPVEIAAAAPPPVRRPEPAPARPAVTPPPAAPAKPVPAKVEIAKAELPRAEPPKPAPPKPEAVAAEPQPKAPSVESAPQPSPPPVASATPAGDASPPLPAAVAPTTAPDPAAASQPAPATASPGFSEAAPAPIAPTPSSGPAPSEVAPAPVEVARPPAASPPATPPAARPVGREDTILARIIANIGVPARELDVPPVREPAPAPSKPAPAKPEPEVKPPPVSATKKPEKPTEIAATKVEKPLDPKVEARRKAEEKKKADEKKKAEAEKAEAKKQAALAKASPSRIWVQVAGGSSEGDLARAWAAVKARAPAAFRGKQGWTTPLRFTNRVLTGPFKSVAEAQAFVNDLTKAGISSFVFSSAAGQQIDKLGGQ